MHKVILMILLAGFSGSAAAKWEVVGKSDSNTIYVDYFSIRKTGNTAKMWFVFDFKAPQTYLGVTLLSTKEQDEFDCKEEKYRRIYLTGHAENMVSGTVVYTEPDPGKWIPIAPDSVYVNLLKIACRKYIRGKSAPGASREQSHH